MVAMALVIQRGMEFQSLARYPGCEQNADVAAGNSSAGCVEGIAYPHNAAQAFGSFKNRVAGSLR